MQIKETANEGLKRAYTVTIPAKEIDERVNSEVKKIAPQVKMPGFRPGKVPANLVRKMHGEQLHAQTLNDMIRESVDKVMADNKLRPAMQPSVELDEGYEEGKDTSYRWNYAGTWPFRMARGADPSCQAMLLMRVPTHRM